MTNFFQKPFNPESVGGSSKAEDITINTVNIPSGVLSKLPAGSSVEEALAVLSNPDLVFTFVNTSAWEANHGLNRYPDIRCENTDGVTLIGDVSYPTINLCMVSFDNNYSGKMFLK